MRFARRRTTSLLRRPYDCNAASFTYSADAPCACRDRAHSDLFLCEATLLHDTTARRGIAPPPKLQRWQAAAVKRLVLTHYGQEATDRTSPAPCAVATKRPHIADDDVFDLLSGQRPPRANYPFAPAAG